MRADVNLSVRPKGETTLGTRTEMKNLNSFKAVERAIVFESTRQIKSIESGEKIVQETRRWDDNKGVSLAMRSKENAEDYRYFPEPDIPPIDIPKEDIERYYNELPEFADQKAKRYVEAMGLSKADAEIIASSKHLASLFEETVALCNNPKEVRYWLIGQIMYFLNDKGLQPEDITLTPKQFAEFIGVMTADRISRQTGKDVLEAMFFSKDSFDLESYIKENNLEQVDDSDAIRETVRQVIADNPKTVEQYKAGQTKVVGFFVGQTMKALKGKAKPDTVNKVLTEELAKL